MKLHEDISSNKWLSLEEFRNLKAHCCLSINLKIKTIHNKYIKHKMFTEKNISMGINDMYNGNDHFFSGSISAIVQYLTSFFFSRNIQKSFELPIKQFYNFIKTENINTPANDEYLKSILNDINSDLIDNNSFNEKDITNAFKLVRFDEIYGVETNKSEWINKDNLVIDPIKSLPDYLVKNTLTLVNNSVSFFKTLNNLMTNLEFFDQTYYEIDNQLWKLSYQGGNSIFIKGEGEFSSNDTIINLICSEKELRNEECLKIFLQYLMCKHSDQPYYKNIHKIGIFNALKNTYYEYDMTNFDKETINEINLHIMGYNFNPKSDIAWIDYRDKNIEIKALEKEFEQCGIKYIEK